MNEQKPDADTGLTLDDEVAAIGALHEPDDGAQDDAPPNLNRVVDVLHDLLVDLTRALRDPSSDADTNDLLLRADAIDHALSRLKESRHGGE